MDQKQLTDLTIQRIKDRGVTLEQIAELTHFLQVSYCKELT